MNNDTDSDTESINTTDTIDQSELTPQYVDVNAYYHKIQERYNFLQTCDEQYKSYNNFYFVYNFIQSKTCNKDFKETSF